MGVFWQSSAEIVTNEPQKLKVLIEQISQDISDDRVTPIHDLNIKGESLFFHSAGYGCYGVESENPCSLLFEKLLERFKGALLCFEAVVPCQSQGYCFSSTWVKPEGAVDWDDEETHYKHSRVLWEDGELKNPTQESSIKPRFGTSLLSD